MWRGKDELSFEVIKRFWRYWLQNLNKKYFLLKLWWMTSSRASAHSLAEFRSWIPGPDSNQAK